MSTETNREVFTPATAGMKPLILNPRARASDGLSLRSVSTRLAAAWKILRELAGDDAYERYCAHHAQHHSQETPLTRREHYIKSQTKKWTGINRCC
jgi:uncharacterized short protein YbdD (DUF466 family)